jgi:hypothetical protein
MNWNIPDVTLIGVIQLFLKIVLPPALGPDITMILLLQLDSLRMCNFLFLFVIQIQNRW